MSCFQVEEKQQVVDRLVVEIFELQKLLYRKDHKHDDAADDVHDVGVKIENLWAEYLEEANKFGKPIEIPCSRGIQYRNAYTAMTVAYFSAAELSLYPNVSFLPMKKVTRAPRCG